ncbi:MAG TPA: response regulator, partial [Nitrospirae bacterium]|nr:response regulator [Nitrospirota bacterium]
MPDILIVEDDFRMRSLLVELLEKDGYTVNAAGDGRSAVTSLSEHSYDVVLTDLKIPLGDGMDILAYSNEVNSKTPVIVITAYATVNSAVEAMKKGAYDYIQKPFDPDELLLLV